MEVAEHCSRSTCCSSGAHQVFLLSISSIWSELYLNIYRSSGHQRCDLWSAEILFGICWNNPNGHLTHSVSLGSRATRSAEIKTCFMRCDGRKADRNAPFEVKPFSCWRSNNRSTSYDAPLSGRLQLDAHAATDPQLPEHWSPLWAKTCQCFNKIEAGKQKIGQSIVWNTCVWFWKWISWSSLDCSNSPAPIHMAGCHRVAMTPTSPLAAIKTCFIIQTVRCNSAR